jgi:hypothetical protein
MRFFCLLVITLLLAGCAGTPAPSTAAAPPVDVAEPTTVPKETVPRSASPTPEDVFEIVAWVNKPEPKLDEVVTVSGSLIKNGVYLGGIPMWAFWPDEEGGPVPHDCVSSMAYQRGICMIYVKDYPVDVYVPVSIRIIYQDQIFTTETGFTPRSK